MAGMRKYPYQQVEVDEHKTIVAIGDNIHRLRTSKGISIRLLALQAGLNERHLYKIENGEHKAGIIAIIRIAKALDVYIDELIKGKT